MELHTRTWNPSGERRALLVHGLGSDGSTMWRLAEHLAEHGFAVTAPDLRGSGESPVADSYSVADLAGDLRAIGTGWDVAVGHSWGGAVVGCLLAEPGFAACGLLLDPVLVVREEDKPALTAALQNEVGGALTLESLRADMPSWDDVDRVRLVEASLKVTPEVVAAALADTSPWNFVDLARTWQVPVTVLAADPAAGALVDESLVAELSTIPTATVRVVAGADHSVHRAAPAVVLDALDGLIARG